MMLFALKRWVSVLVGASGLIAATVFASAQDTMLYPAGQGVTGINPAVIAPADFSAYLEAHASGVFAASGPTDTPSPLPRIGSRVTLQAASYQASRPTMAVTSGATADSTRPRILAIHQPPTGQGTLSLTADPEDPTEAVAPQQFVWTPAPGSDFSGRVDFTYLYDDGTHTLRKGQGVVKVLPLPVSSEVQALQKCALVGLGRPQVSYEDPAQASLLLEPEHLPYSLSITTRRNIRTGCVIPSDATLEWSARQNGGTFVPFAAAPVADFFALAYGIDPEIATIVLPAHKTGVYDFRLTVTHDGTTVSLYSPPVTVAAQEHPTTLSAPIRVTATQGSLTDAVRVAWSPVAGAKSYNVYGYGGKVNTAPIFDTQYVVPATLHELAEGCCWVTAVGDPLNALGAVNESPRAYAKGWPNLPPTAAYAALSGTDTAPSKPTDPHVSDPNLDYDYLGWADHFQVEVTKQPPVGQGTVRVVKNKLQWQPDPSGKTPAGSSMFTFAVVDQGGERVEGTGVVTIAHSVSAGHVPQFVVDAVHGNSDQPLRISGSFGVESTPSADTSDEPPVAGLRFNPEELGQWSLQLYRVESKRIAAVGQPVTQLNGLGQFEFNLPAQPASTQRFRIVATQTSNVSGQSPSPPRSVVVAAVVHNATPLPVTLSATPESGGMAQLRLNVADRMRLADLGSVQMLRSDDDGATFAAVGSNASGPVVTTKLPGEGNYQFKAVVTNKWSGAATETNVATVQNFTPPVVSIVGNSMTLVGLPVTLKADLGALHAADLEFEWKVFSDRLQFGAGGKDTFDVVPLAAGLLTVTLDVRARGAPTNRFTTRHLQSLVQVIPASPPKATIGGPTVIQIGKAYQWRAFQPNPLAADRTWLSLSGRWELPDGTTSTDNPVVYTPKETDSTTTLRWVARYYNPSIEAQTVSELTYRPWAYTWPAWRLATAVISPYAPARVRFDVTTELPSLAGVNAYDESVRTTFALPPGASLVSQSGSSAVVEFPQAGTYQVTAVVTDTHSNRTVLLSPMLTVLGPKPFSFTFAVTPNDRWNRVGPISLRTMATSVANDDAVAGTTFFVNGAQVGPEVPGNVATVVLSEPGSYDFRAVMRSVRGQTTEASQSLTLALGDAPKCVLTRHGDGVKTLWFSSSCTLQQGSIARYRWRVNGGALLSVTATSLSFPPAQIAAGVRAVELIAITDRGQVGGATFDVGAGTSTAF